MDNHIDIQRSKL